MFEYFFPSGNSLFEISLYIFLISFGIGIIKYNLKKITNIIKNRNLKYNLIQQDDDKNYKLFNTDEFELNHYIDDNKFKEIKTYGFDVNNQYTNNVIGYHLRELVIRKFNEASGLEWLLRF